MAALFFSPYTTWRPVYDYLFTWSDVLFCLAGLTLLATAKLNFRPFADLSPLWFGGLAIMLLGFIVSSLLNGDPIRLMIVAGQYCFAFALLPMLLVHGGRAEFRHYAMAFVAGVLAMELFGAIVYAYYKGAYEPAQAISVEFITGAHRLGAFMADANWNAAMIAMAAPFVLLLSRIGRLGWIATSVAAAILCAGLLLSGSFTGVVSTALATLLFLAVSGGRQAARTALVLAALAVITFGSGLTLPTAFQQRVQGAIEQGDLSQAGTFLGRMELIREAWQIVDRTTLTGLGVDQYRVVSHEKAPVHNMYLLVWAEGGLLSLIGWIMMMIVPFVASFGALARDRALAGLGLAVTTSFILFSIAAPHMYSRSWAVPLMLAIAWVCTGRANSAPYFRTNHPG